MVNCKLAQISFRFSFTNSGLSFEFFSIKYKTAVFKPLKLKSNGPTLGFGKRNALGLPKLAYLID